MSNLWLPTLSEYDPPLTSEGSIDPLGLYPIADALGVRLVPGVRERQSYPRFLTAMAVSSTVCSAFGDEALAVDEVSEPWQVFEWYVVEGLVRTATVDDEIRGLPGREKARAAIADKLPLSADRYLKTPTVFGFHGVYRLLARNLGVELAGSLGEFGYELVSAWAAEQGLPGFVGTGGGAGAEWRTKLTGAIGDGLNAGHVSRSAGWAGWDFFHHHLAPHDIGSEEAALLRHALLGSEDGFRGRVLRSLVSDHGQSLWNETESERAFHEFLLKSGDPELSVLLRAILAYEGFSRLLQDAFDDCRFLMSSGSPKTHISELAEAPGVVTAAEQVAPLAQDLAQRLEPFGEAMRFDQAFGWAQDKLGPKDWVARLLQHHRDIQQHKPPAGKASWVEQLEGGAYLIRPAYRVEQGGLHDGSYVHGYRTNPLWSFARDLRWVN